MRIFILIALLFAFTAGSYVDMAHASAEDHLCAHHQVDHDDHVDNEPCHSGDEQSQCDDCCCVHSHSMATSVTPTKTPHATKQQNIIVALDSHYSAELSGLKRPPRI